MPHPGVFLGSRREFMISQKKDYADGVIGGYVKDAVANIQRRYFKRFPIDLLHEQEPTVDQLANVDDDAPDLDEAVVDEENLTPEQVAEAMKFLEERRLLIEKRKKQIKRWLEYQHMKDNDVDTLESGALNPFTVLLYQLTGIGYQRPRRRSAVNVWRRAHRAEIEEKAKEELDAQDGPKRKKLAKIREAIATSMFEELSEEDCAYYKDLAQEEHQEAMKKWKHDTTSPPSTKPEDRQKVIQALIRFAQPILDGMCAAAGWQATLAIGGPEPANGGRLRLITINSGSLPGPVKMNFTRSEAVAYHKYFVPMFGKYLSKCYAVEECKSRALPSGEGFELVGQLINGGEAEAIDLGFLDSASASSLTSPTAPQLPPPSVASTNPPTLASNPIPTAQPNNTNPSQLIPAASGDLSDDMSTALSHYATPSPAISRQTTPNVNSPPFSPHNIPSPRSPSASPMDSPPSPIPIPSSQVDIAGIAVEAYGLPSADSQMPTIPSIPAPLLSTAPTLLAKPDVNVSPKRCLQEDDEDANALLSVSKKTRLAIPALASVTPKRGGKSKSHPKPHPLKGPTNPSSSVQSHASLRPISASLSPQPTSSNAGVSSLSDPTLPALPSSAPNQSTPTTISICSATIATTSTAQVSSSSNVTPPSWFQNAMNQFTICPTTINNVTASSLGKEWTDLVAAWSQFETKSAFGENAMGLKAKLSPKDHPRVVGDWIARARSSNYRPEISNLGSYRDSFWTWWRGLQPEWRVVNGEIERSSLDGDWAALRISGINGLVSVMAALLYWGLNAKGSPTHTKHWSQAVRECTDVFMVL